MSQPTACIRCKGIELVEATFVGAGSLRLAADESHASPVSARVCLACGAVLLTATEPGALRGAKPEGPQDTAVQEADF
jgi:hypothetical protein